MKDGTLKLTSITEEAVARHGIADDASNDRARSQTGADENTIAALGPEILHKGDGFEGEGRHTFGGVGSWTAIWGSTDDHVGVAVTNKICRGERVSNVREN